MGTGLASQFATGSRIDRHRRGYFVASAMLTAIIGWARPLVRTTLGLYRLIAPGAPVNRPSRSVAAFQIHA